MPKKEKIQPLQIFQMLPATNCKLCGCETCMAYAFALIGREKTLADCPDLQTEDFRESLQFLSGYFDEAGEVAETGLFIDKDKCHGCGDCLVVCNKAITSLVLPGGFVQKREDMPPVLGIIDGVVRVVNWKSCKRVLDPPEYCRVCEEKCPSGALELVK